MVIVSILFLFFTVRRPKFKNIVLKRNIIISLCSVYSCNCCVVDPCGAINIFSFERVRKNKTGPRYYRDSRGCNRSNDSDYHGNSDDRSLRPYQQIRIEDTVKYDTIETTSVQWGRRDSRTYTPRQ